MLVFILDVLFAFSLCFVFIMILLSSWLFCFMIWSIKNFLKTFTKATSLVQYNFIHKNFLFYSVTWMSSKSCWIFIELMVIQAVYTFDFVIVAFKSAFSSGEETNSEFSPSDSCLLFLFFHPSGQQWNTYLNINICQDLVEHISSVCVWVLV